MTAGESGRATEYISVPRVWILITRLLFIVRTSLRHRAVLAKYEHLLAKPAVLQIRLLFRIPCVFHAEAALESAIID